MAHAPVARATIESGRKSVHQVHGLKIGRNGRRVAGIIRMRREQGRSDQAGSRSFVIIFHNPEQNASANQGE
jgi:hypothetical protein